MQIRLTLVFSFLVLLSCNSNEDRQHVSNTVVQSLIRVHYPNGNSNFQTTDSISVEISSEDDIEGLSGVEVLLNDDTFNTYQAFPFTLNLFGGNLKMGRNVIRINALSDIRSESKTTTFNVFPVESPVKYTYRVKSIHEHDDMAYTQGLFFHKGLLYEGTGQRTLSSLRTVDMETGKVIKMVKIDPSFFGEGITLLGDKIYQLTWNSQVGMVYNASDLSEVRKFYYRGEGWGLTTDSTYLIRSDGSNKLFFHSPEDFREIRTIEVYTDEGPVNKLNELEYIDGLIYANIYQKDVIAIINPSNGKVEGMIDMKGLLQKKFRTDQTDVLNGIAFDALGRRIFVTGKFWSKLFEIEVSPVSGS